MLRASGSALRLRALFQIVTLMGYIMCDGKQKDIVLVPRCTGVLDVRDIGLPLRPGQRDIAATVATCLAVCIGATSEHQALDSLQIEAIQLSVEVCIASNPFEVILR
ncbi:hypothetical protein Efla_007226 [Eimeria flavescens]